MSLLKRAESGIKDLPLFGVIFGEPGSGKSTFGSQFPKPFFVDIEKGSRRLNVERFIPNDLMEVMQVSRELLDSSYETIIFDSMDVLESLVWKQSCLENGWLSIEDPGYGKGYVVALKKWEELMILWDRMRMTKNIILICHTETKAANDPTQLVAYDRIQIKLNKHAAALIRAKADMILFAQKEQILKVDKNAKKAKVVGEEYVLHLKGGPGFEGKNRYSMPEKISLSFPDFWEAYQKGLKDTAEQTIAEIQALFPKIEKEKVVQIKKFIEENKTNVNQLKIALNRASVLAQPKTEELKDVG